MLVKAVVAVGQKGEAAARVGDGLRIGRVP